MKILVLNGSPKGKYSITLHTVMYLEKLFKEHEFDILHVGQRIHAIERNFDALREQILSADMLLFSYPVYTFIAPYQLHRFVELLKESGIDVSGKYAAQITTSKHFYDVTAHRYIKDNCADLSLKYLGGLSADMDDLTTRKGQKDARDFFKYIMYCVKHGITEKNTLPDCTYTPVPADVPVNVKAKKEGDVVIVTNCEENDLRLKKMIDRFRAVLPVSSRVVNIREYPFSGGCLGCFNCAVSGKCIYKDKFDEFLRGDIQNGNAIVYAFTIKDHSMGASFKLYDDRQFCNGHRTVTMGMPMGYLICGNYSAEANLQTIVEGRAQVGGNFLAGIATDEHDPNREIDRLASSLCYAIKTKYAPPQNFYGVGGMKIFRDLIWIMQGMMKADHRFYKEHGQYDFPQKQIRTMLKMQLVGALISSPAVKSKMGNAMNEGMIAPYKKVLDELDKLK